jgi:ABC-type glycerol-3-phosphate transport system substrate-binding protein
VAAVAPVGAAVLTACGGAGTATSGSTTGAAPVAVTSSAPAKAVTTATTAAKATSATAASAGAAKPTPTPQAGDSRKGAATTVRLSYGWGGTSVLPTWDTISKQFGDAFPSFNVQWVVGDNNTKLVATIAAGTPPDAAVGNAPYPEFWAKGAATALDSMIAASKVINKKDIPTAAWDYASYKGKVYGVPAVEAFVRYSLCMDMTNLQKYSIDPKTLSWDWDTVVQLQQQLTTKTASGDIAILGIDPQDCAAGGLSGGNPFYWGHAYDIEYFDPTTGKFNFDNDQLVEAMTMIKRLHDVAGGVQAVKKFQASTGFWNGNPKAMLPSGMEAMAVNIYTAPGVLAHDAPSRSFAYTWAPVPTSHKGWKVQATGGHNAFIPSGAKYAAQGFQVIEHLVGDLAEQTIYDNIGWLGARTSFLAKVNAGKYPGLDFFIQSVKQNDKLFGMPANPIENQTATLWNTALQSVLTAKATPKDALAQLQQVVTAQMSQQFPNG